MSKFLSWISSQDKSRIRKINLPQSLQLSLICFQIWLLCYQTSPGTFDFPLLRGFGVNASAVVGPPGYEILLRQTWCYVILHN